MSPRASVISHRLRVLASFCSDRRVLWGALAVSCCAMSSFHAAAQEVSYVVMGPDGAVARAILQKDVPCPAINVDGAQQQMDVRAKPNPSDRNDAFPVTVCEKLIPPSAKFASISGKALPLPKDTLANIVVIGDTGCRMKAASGDIEDQEDGESQSCNRRSKWPFAKVSSAAAAVKPDLVIHVGDYLYRASECGDPDRCQGSPYGDDWPAWNADFFSPAKDLLAAAPWIITRGNHEICRRAGVGYFRLLDPVLARGQVPPPCADNIPPYNLTVAGKEFILLDSSGGSDQDPPPPGDVERYRTQFSSLKPAPNSWLISHRPIWGVKTRDRFINQSLHNALPAPDHLLPTEIELVLSGHIHLWEAIGFTDRLSPQFVVGDGGTKLVKDINKTAKHRFPDKEIWERKVDVKGSRSEQEWGFTQFTPRAGGWTARLRGANGGKLVKCTVVKGEVDCR